MISEQAKLTGAKWAINKKTFLSRFAAAPDVVTKKAVIALLFNITIPKQTEWQPLALEVSFENPDVLILKYQIYYVIPMATLENPQQVKLGEPYLQELILEGFHQYAYAHLPKLQLFLLTRDAAWDNGHYRVLQIHKTAQQFQQYLAQIVRAGLSSQNVFAIELQQFLQAHGQQLNQGFAFRFQDQVSQMVDPSYDLVGSLWSSITNFASLEAQVEVLLQFIRDHAIHGAQNTLATKLND